ncbi:RHS repeat-associated core domain-containing protein [Serratia liquefaciens]|uniref:RHS repeat-associated core domain-containing protein n=1 Tax=Serratia liquefaciens TaxID=614 RepID=UPI0032DED69F
MTVSLLVNNKMNSPQLSRSNERGVSTHSYSPFGAGQLADAADSMPGFNGQRRDPVSRSYHLGNGYRAYNPLLMRFNCPDNLSPFGAGGINPYTYCAGDPINRADPSGHISWQAGVGIGLGILGIIATAGAAAMAISAAGGIGAALSAASGTSLIMGGVGVTADVIGIASGAVSDSNPELSATLGWVSIGLGGVGMATGTALLSKGVQASTSKISQFTWYTHPSNKFDSFYLVDINTGGLCRIRLELGRNGKIPYPFIEASNKRYYGFSKNKLPTDDGRWSIRGGRLAHNGKILSQKPRVGYHIYDSRDVSGFVHMGNKVTKKNSAILPTGINHEHLNNLASRAISELKHQSKNRTFFIHNINPSETQLSEAIKHLFEQEHIFSSYSYV